RHGSVCAARAIAGERDQAAGGEAPRVVVRTRGPVLIYTGSITPKGVARARALLDASPQVREVVVNSGGGDVAAGMDFGDMIHARGLGAEVSGGLRMPPCATYVFPAPRRHTIAPRRRVI